MEFHFIMTITHPVNNGFNTATFNGTYITRPNETRQDVYNALFKMITEETGFSGRPNVTFFSLEPNHLSAA